MALNDFFRINLPYGLKKNADGDWFAFNREYMPLGYKVTDSPFKNNHFVDLPVYTKYKRLTENAILKIIKNPERIQRDKDGAISDIFFYDDRTNPQSFPEYWNDYFDIIKAFSKFDKDED